MWIKIGTKNFEESFGQKLWTKIKNIIIKTSLNKSCEQKLWIRIVGKKNSTKLVNRSFEEKFGKSCEQNYEKKL